MPSLDLSILNQRQTPAFYADILANRPAAGFIGRIFVSTDTYAFYRDNGTSWDLIGGPGTGTVTGTGTTGQVTYWNGASTITGSNNLFWDTANNRLGINNTTPGASIDVHSAVSSIAQFNQTVATNNSLLVLQNSGSALWRLGNYYNAGANDFGVFDVIGAIQPLTIKKTSGQVLIGTSTVGSGKLVVASASSDNGIQIVGATAPSLRIDSAETGATKRIGIGLATAVNNFIQNSQNLDMCIFNGSTSAAGNMLFGIYDTGLTNVQEAARISAARNFLIGTITDAGQKLQVSGTAYISGNTSIGTTLNSYILQTSADGAAGQVQLDQYGNVGSNILLRSARGTSAAPTATTAGDLLGSIGSRGYDGTNFSGGGRAGMYMYAAENFTATNQGSLLIFGTTSIGTASRVERMRITDAGNVGINTNTPGGALSSSYKVLEVNGTFPVIRMANSSTIYLDLVGDSSNSYIQTGTTTNLVLGTNNTERARITSSGNLLIGTTTDNGKKLQVNGDINGNIDLYLSRTGVAPAIVLSQQQIRLVDQSTGFSQSININSDNLQFSGGIRTAAPSGGSSQTWKLGNYTAGVAVQAGKVRVEINGVAYDLLTA